jgi:hypothetical protein
MELTLIRRRRDWLARVARCDELEERSAREMVIHALFGFLTQQVVLLTHRTCTYIGKIDNAHHSSA